MATSTAQMANKGSGLSELKARLFFVLGALFVYRIGSHIPVPGIDPKALAVMFDGSFPGLVEELIFKKGFRLEKIEPGSHYETLQRGEVVRNFSRGLFNAMCEDARVHSESNYFTSVKRLK